MAILDDPEREFAASSLLRLEVLPKALFHKRREEAEFYETFFREVAVWHESVDNIMADAFGEARTAGLATVDALHIVAAVTMGASEFITTEKPTRSIHRTRRVKVISIHSD